MNSGIAQFSSYWRDQSAALIEILADDIAEHAGPFFASMPRERLVELVGQVAQAWQSSFDSNDPTPMINFIHTLGLQRADDRVDIKEPMHVLDVWRKHIWRLMSQLYAAGDWDMDVVEQIERWLHEQRDALMSGYNETLKEAWVRLAEREQDLETQGRLIQELSTPIVPIHEGVMVLPLVGAVDSRRATQVMESVLEKIVENQAEVLILDITGVPIVDTGVANHLIQMARAVTLLGAQVVLVGIGAEIAQTIVQLGVDLHGVTTLANLQVGISYALARRGFAIRTVDAGASANGGYQRVSLA